MGDGLAKNLESSKTKCHLQQHCDITLLAHDNLNVLIIIAYFIGIQKIMYTTCFKKILKSQSHESFKKDRHAELTYKRWPCNQESENHLSLQHWCLWQNGSV